MLQLGKDRVEEVRKEIWKEIGIAISHVEAGEDLLGEWAIRANELEQQYYKALAICTMLWEAFPQPEHHKTIAREKEVGFRIRLDKAPTPESDPLIVEVMGTIDHMIHDEKTDRIFIRDYKSSQRDPMFTTTGYQWSLQCRLYRLLAGAYLQEYLDKEGNKPFSGRHVDGFILDVLQVPRISMCNKDKDYDEVEHTISRGPRKGEIELRREYRGRPKFENYLKRINEWFQQEGLHPFQSNCVMYTEPTLPDELRNDLRIAAVYQNVDAVPENFPRDETTRYCKNFERQCKYYDLCSTSQTGWDEIIAQKYDIVVPDSAKEIL
jgi:hypothetical protein